MSRPSYPVRTNIQWSFSDSLVNKAVCLPPKHVISGHG